MYDSAAGKTPPHITQRHDAAFSARVLEAWMPLLPIGIFAWLITYLQPIAEGVPCDLAWNWVPSLEVRLSLRLDGLSLLFALLISGIGSLILIYAPGYMVAHRDRFRLYAWLVIFMLAMLGLVLADNVILMFIFWELTSVASYMLVGFNHESTQARRAALQALLVTGLGGLALLAGLLLLASVGKSYEFSQLLTQRETVLAHPFLIPMAVLILLGTFTKSAQVPFHFWLPSAMAAPTPVSAYLHSATMVKAGVYLAARLHPVFHGAPIWSDSLLAFGGMTAVTGGLIAMQHTDLKRILAYSTVSSLGALMMLLGLGTEFALQAAVVLLVVHSLYKGALFLVAGAVVHETGTRDARRLDGLARSMPVLAVAAALAAWSMAGLPPTGGFLAKELIYEATIHLDKGSWLATSALWVANVGLVVVAGLVAVKPFCRQRRVDRRDDVSQPPRSTNANAHDVRQATPEIRHPRMVPWRLTAPPLVLGLLGVVLGLCPAWCGSAVIQPAVRAMGGIQPVSLKLWHGIHYPLVLSALTILAGLVLYMSRARVWRAGRFLQRLNVFGPTSAYEFALESLKFVAIWQTRWLQNGRLRGYMLVFLTSFVALVGFTAFHRFSLPAHPDWLELRLYELFIPVLIVAATWMTIRASSRLAAVCALGVIGYAVAMLFVMYGSPDLAMTQLAIETLTVILFVLVIYRLPKFSKLSTRATMLRDGLIAAAAGLVMATVTLATTFAHTPSRVTSFFAQNSLPAAKGRNVVNVILVDFRGLDTLGEITVLAVAALGIFALMRLRVRPEIRL